MGAVQQDLEIIQGKTFEAAFGWAQGRFVWAPISAVSQTAPLHLTVVGHDIKDGWPYWISDVREPACLNNVKPGCDGEPDELGEPYLAEVVDADTLAINHLNGGRFKAYVNGGAIRYYAREDITGYTAQMQVRRSARDAAVLFEASSTGASPMIAIDAAASTFHLTIPADALSAEPVFAGIYEIEITSPAGIRYQLACGAFTVARDVVR